jgi:putative phosphoribosyl transferase
MIEKQTISGFRDIEISVNDTDKIRAVLHVIERAKGIIIFAHGSGSGRLSPRNQYVASIFQQKGFATLLFDLLTDPEEAVDFHTRQFRFDIALLTERLLLATKLSLEDKDTKKLPIGYFGASTGAAAALCAAAELGSVIKAVVSRGGRPDLAAEKLPSVTAPTLFIVGGNDHSVLDLNKKAAEKLNAVKELFIVPSASHLFEQRGALEQVALVSADWFANYLKNG